MVEAVGVVDVGVLVGVGLDVGFIVSDWLVGDGLAVGVWLVAVGDGLPWASATSWLASKPERLSNCQWCS